MAERLPRSPAFPCSLPFVPNLELSFAHAVTYFVGENGSGKSTLVEAIAEACGLPIWGGSRNEAATRQGPDERSALGGYLRCSFARRPRDGYFFRADSRRTSPHCWTSATRTSSSSTTLTGPTEGVRCTRSPTARRSWRSC